MCTSDTSVVRQRAGHQPGAKEEVSPPPAKAASAPQGIEKPRTWTDTLVFLAMLPAAATVTFWVAPLALWNMHLPFDVVPWYLQLLWHYAHCWLQFNFPHGRELVRLATNLFVPHLEKNKDRCLVPLRPGQPAPGPVGQNGATLADMEKISIEEFREMGVKGFYKKFGRPNRAVRICDLAFEEGKLGEWSAEYFAEKYGDVEFDAYQRFDNANIIRTNFRDFFKQMMEKGPIYARGLKGLYEADPKLRDAPPHHLYKDMRCTLTTPEQNYQDIQLMFFAAEGTRTQIHWDVTNNFASQFQGHKTWWIFDPSQTMLMYPFVKGTNQWGQTQFDHGNIDHERYPAAKYLQGWKAKMNPGDTLWLPSWWPHGVFNHSTPTGMAVVDGVGAPHHSFELNFIGSFFFFLNPVNWLDGLDRSRAHRRWYL